MDPKHDSRGMLLAPGAASSSSTYAFASQDRRSPSSFPPVDEHLVKPEVSRDEYIRGRKIVTMGANPPHAEAQVRADFLIAPHVRPGYVAAADLLTRASKKSNFATDVCVRKVGIDPSTGSRYLEELSFEIVNEQSMSDVMDKAEDLITRGVRRIFAIFVKTQEIGEWSPSKREFVPLDIDGMFEDQLFIRPIAVRALIDGAVAEIEVVEALWKKGNSKIASIREEGRRTVLFELLEARFGDVPVAIRDRVNAAKIDDVRTWTVKLLSSATMDDVFD